VSLSIRARRGRVAGREHIARGVSAPARPARGQGTRWVDRHAGAKVFAAALILNLIVSFVLAYVWQIGNADALARTTNAYYVLFARDPHLASIGFIWPILPSFLQLPLLPLLHLVGHPEFAGPIVSSLFGAGVLVVLGSILGSCGVTGWTRLLWLALVQFNPLFWWLAGSGLSEMPAMFFLVLGLYAFLKFSADGSIRVAMLLTLSLIGAFLVRYESLSSMAALAVALVLLRWPARRAEGAHEGWLSAQWRTLRRDWPQLEGRLLVVLAPAAFIVVLWVLMNWMIMGDPLYFDHSVYSLAKAPDVARNYGPGHPLYHEMHNLPLTLLFALGRNLQGNLAFLFVAVLGLLVALRRDDRQLLGLVVLTAGTFALSIYEIYAGTFPPYLRYWSLTTPFAVALAAVLAQRLAGSRWSVPFRYAVSLLLLFALLVTLSGLNYHYGSVDEQRLGAYLTRDLHTYNRLVPADFYVVKEHDARLVSPALDHYSAGGLTMIDTETGFSAVLYAHHPERLAINPDRDFPALLADPRRRVRYIFVTNPQLGRERDVIGTRYPALFFGKLPWVRLVGEVKGTIQPWHIFAIVPYGQPLGPVVPVVAATAGTSTLYHPTERPGTNWFLATIGVGEVLSVGNAGSTPAHVTLHLLATYGERRPVSLIVPPHGSLRRHDVAALPPWQQVGVIVTADRPITVGRLIAAGTAAGAVTASARAAVDHTSRRWVFVVARASGAHVIPRLVVLNPNYRALRVTARVYDRRGRLLRVASMLLGRRSRLAIDPGRLALTSTGIANMVVVRSRWPVVVEQQDT